MSDTNRSFNLRVPFLVLPRMPSLPVHYTRVASPPAQAAAPQAIPPPGCCCSASTALRLLYVRSHVCAESWAESPSTLSPVRRACSLPHRPSASQQSALHPHLQGSSRFLCLILSPILGPAVVFPSLPLTPRAHTRPIRTESLSLGACPSLCCFLV